MIVREAGVGAEFVPVAGGFEVVHDPAVGDEYAFRSSGRSGGVGDEGDVVGGHRDVDGFVGVLVDVVDDDNVDVGADEIA
ncbi:hypothetical protein GCM10020255_028180 [Rhodococcus baikonurensis]